MTKRSNYSPFAWALRNDAKTVAESIEDDPREEWQIQLAALLDMLDDEYTVTDQNGKVWHAGTLDECRRHFADLIHNEPRHYFYVTDPLGETVEHGGNREAL